MRLRYEPLVAFFAAINSSIVLFLSCQHRNHCLTETLKNLASKRASQRAIRSARSAAPRFFGAGIVIRRIGALLAQELDVALVDWPPPVFFLAVIFLHFLACFAGEVSLALRL